MMNNTFVFWRHYGYRSCGGVQSNVTRSTSRSRRLLQKTRHLSSFSQRNSFDGVGVVMIATAATTMMMMLTTYWAAALCCCRHDDDIGGEKDPEKLLSFIPLSNSSSSPSSSSSSSSSLPCQRPRGDVASLLIAYPTVGVDNQRPLLRSIFLLFMDTFMALTNRIIIMSQQHHHGLKNDVCRCEALAARHNVETINNGNNNNNIRNSAAADEWNIDKSLYELMQVPDRALLTSHVIYGQLLQKDLVESYTVYRLKVANANDHVVDDGNKIANHNNNNNITDNTDAPPPPLPIVMAAISLGKSLNGHDGIVHGGVLALLMDDVLGFGYEALGNIALAVTANLTINFRTPCPASSDICITACLLQRKGRKLQWKVQVTSPDKTILYCEGTSVYVIPKNSVMQSSEC